MCLSVSALSVLFVLEMLFAYWGTGILISTEIILVFLIGFVSPFYIIFVRFSYKCWTTGAVIVKELTNETNEIRSRCDLILYNNSD